MRGWERKNWSASYIGWGPRILEHEETVNWFETNPCWRCRLTTGRNQLSDSPWTQTDVFSSIRRYIIQEGSYKVYLVAKRVIDEFIREAQAQEKDLEIKIGRMCWILRQYSRKAFDFHLPWIQTMSGWIPLRRILVHPLMWNVWTLSGSKPALTQIWLHLSSQFIFVRGSQLPLVVLNANMGASCGTFPFAELWCFRAGTGAVGSSMLVRVILAPLVPVVLDQGMSKLEWCMPRMVVPYSIRAEFVTWQEGSNRLQEGTHSLEDLLYHGNS